MNNEDYSIEPLSQNGAAVMTLLAALIGSYGAVTVLQMPPTASLPTIEW